MNDTAPNEKQIFSIARQIDQPEAREAYLEQVCFGDSTMHRRINALLRANSEADKFLDPTSATLAQNHALDPGIKPGEVIDRYKLLQQIGEGGFGVVYMAEQERPVRRRVALKVIKAGMDTKAVIARFEAERQALAMMDHPNIARVLDAGATDNGRPYFVMELVKGIPITEYADQAALSTQERLELFREVCLAVQHAHHKGIIHRDLKPSNIMVTMRDDKPVVKVIDFGIAKATEQKLTEKTLFTNFGQMIGTPMYMSPEQAAMSEFDVDTRSDVYSLGVLLYELLTGATPFDAKSLRSVGFDEMRRMIREDQPPCPSTRLSTLANDTKLAVASKRHATPQALSRQIHGDLDLIVMKALEKDRTRRYESASALAEDIQRHLNDEPIAAVAPSTVYKLRRFARRNKGPVTVAAVFALLLVGGIVASTWQAVRATRAESLAVKEAERANQAESQALELANRATAAAASEKAANQQAQKRLAQLEKGNEIITSLFIDLDMFKVQAGTEPLEAVLAMRLVEAADQLVDESVGDPIAVATLQNRLGKSLLSLGYPEDALKLFERVYITFSTELADDAPSTLDSMRELAKAHNAAGHPDRAIPLLEQALKLQKVKLGDEHHDTLLTMNNLAEACKGAGQYDRAVQLWEQVLKVNQALHGLEDQNTIVYMNNLALGYKRAGQFDRAIPLFEQALELEKKVMGKDHPYTLGGMDNLASAYTDAGQLDRALPLFEETLNLKLAKLGRVHPHVILTMHNYALALRAAGDMDRAISLMERTLALCKEKMGDDHPDTLTTLRSLGLTYQAAGQLDRAVPMLEQAHEGYQARLGEDHPETINTLTVLAKAYKDSGRMDRVMMIAKQLEELEKPKAGAANPDALDVSGQP